MISSENVALNMNFLVSNTLATKKATKATKTTLFKKCIFWAKIDFLTFFTFFTFFSKWDRDIDGFFFWKSLWCFKPISKIISKFRHPQKFLRVHFWGSHKWKISKNPKIWIFLKLHLNAFRYRFRVQNGSKTPQGPISGHIMKFWTI